MANVGNIKVVKPFVEFIGGGNIGVSVPIPTLIIDPLPTTGDGDITTPLLIVNITEATTGSAALKVPGLQIALTGFSDVGLEITVPLPTLSISGTTDYYSSIALVIPTPTIAISGITGQIGSAALIVPQPTLAVTGYTGTSGDAALVIPSLTIDIRALPSGYNCMVVNLDNGAITKYEDFDFDGIFEFNSLILAYKSTGIYALGGDDDAGTDIASVVQTMLDDFGTSQLKQLPDGLLGVSSDGSLSVRTVGDNSLSSVQSMSTSSDKLITKRVKFPKGLKSRYWGVKISNVSGADFTLDSIELLTRILDRRINE